MVYLEALRNGQDEFDSNTLDVWYFEMLRMNWTDDDFRRAIISVSRAKIFGKITFDCFLNSVDLYTSEEVMMRVNQIIEHRKRLAEQQGWTEERLAAEGLENVQLLWARKRIDMLEKIEKRIGKRAKRVEYFIRNCDTKTKEEILDIAIQKSVMVKDKFWEMILPMTAPYLLDEVENMIFRMKG